MPSEKNRSYASHVYSRKVCKACPALTNPSDVYESGICLDSGEIGPWSLWQNSLDARILLVGQDWGDIKGFRQQGGRDSENSETNRNLIKLFGSIGISIKGPDSEEKHQDLFFTNAVLCLKEGGAQAVTDKSWFETCGKMFLRPLIELVEPKVVIALGEKAYRAIMDAYYKPIPKYKKYSEVVEIEDGIWLNGKNRLFPVYHPSRRIINTYRPMDVQFKDWLKIKKYMDRIETEELLPPIVI